MFLFGNVGCVWESWKSEIFWEGEGINELGKRSDNGETVIRVDSKYFRPAEVEALLGDPSKAKAELGWEPEITAQEMCKEMVEEDHKAARRSALLKEHNLELPVSVES